MIARIAPLETGWVLRAFVVGYEVAAANVEAPPWIIELQQRAGGYCMSYPTVVGAVRRPSAARVQAMAEDPDWATLRAEFPVLAALAALFTADGYRLLAWADLGERTLFAPRAVDTPDDLQRLRVRVDAGNEIEAAMAHVLRVDGIRLATSEVTAGLQTGMVDTVQASPRWLIASQWFRFGMRAGVRVGPAIGGVVRHERAYARLSRADRRVVEEVSVQLEDTMRELVAAEDRQATETLASWGIHVAEPSEAMRDGYQRVGAYAAGRLFPAAWLERVEVALGRR
jgi:TRAP-type C4-dicarboxylate transport system substrate-binding protein